MLGLTRRAAVVFAAVVAMAAPWESAANAQPHPASKDDSLLLSQLRETRARVDGLQNELRRIQAGMKLAEAQFQAAPKADLHVVDAMSAAFVMTGLRVWLDDAPILAREDERGVLGAVRELHWVTGALAPGEHVVRVVVQLRGNGAVLPYMRAYRFELATTHKFTTSVGRTWTVSMRTFERSDETTPFVHMPAVEWEDEP